MSISRIYHPLITFYYDIYNKIRRANLRIVILARLALIIAVLNPLTIVYALPSQQEITPSEKALFLLSDLSPDERVGQLFLVTFRNTNVGPDTQIHDLITNHHIGGVILQAANDNFTTGENSLNDILQLNRQLQLNDWSASQESREDPSTGESISSAFIPLFIGISQEGDGYPYDQILNNVTPLPNQMAMGATWNSELVTQVSSVLGHELASLGFNLLLGPSLDVLETPQPESSSDLGTRTFGGDPYWVGELGRAFTTGIHQGSQGRVAVVAKHFPGNGGADRLPEEEVSTVRKSLEELNSFDLAPFYAVTGDATSPEATVDALLSSHIRYQGFQENIRATTRPVSFDPQAFSLLMSLPQLDVWRQNGGVMISDNLGSQAVQRFYELTGQEFDVRRVALNAFLAGNDLLYLGELNHDNETDSYTNVVNTLEFFSQKYQDDPAFAQRVDESVLRILTLKYRLNPSFSLGQSLLSSDDIENIGTSGEITFEVARQAATIISPPIAELDDTVPDPPNQSDRIVFFSDVRSANQCSECPEQPVFSRDALEQAVLRLYGPQAGGLVRPNNLISYSFEDLIQLLDGQEEEDTFPVENSLQRAHWIVFALLNVSNENPSSQALHRFLAERPDLFQQKRLIVFAFNAPYYLDATNISKITAYYSLYSKPEQFVDVASRLLFRELRPEGALPVSVPGVGYDLIAATSPDPNQTIPLQIDIESSEEISGTVTPEAIPTPEFQLGNLIPLRTGVILDHNGNYVPDGTPVQFYMAVAGEISALPQIETTSNGVARTTVQINTSGPLEIWAESELAISEVLHFDIPVENGELVTVTPTVDPTSTPSPSPSPTITAQVIPATEEPVIPQTRPNLTDWFLTLILASAIGALAYRLAALIGLVRWGVRSAFLALIGGLVAYSYLTLKLPGSENLLHTYGGWVIIGITMLGSALGIIVTWSWRMIQKS